MNDGWWATRYQTDGWVWDDARVPEVDALVKELGDTFAELGWEVPNDVAAVLHSVARCAIVVLAINERRIMNTNYEPLLMSAWQINGSHRIVQAWGDDGLPAEAEQVSYTKPTGFGLAILVVFTDGSEFAYPHSAQVEVLPV